MADLKFLERSQFMLTPGALTDVYTCPNGRSTEVTVHLCNQEAPNTTFRLAFAKGGEADDPKQYFYYDTTLYGGNTFEAVYACNEGDVIRVSSPGTVSVNITVNLSNKLFG